MPPAPAAGGDDSAPRAARASADVPGTGRGRRRPTAAAALPGARAHRLPEVRCAGARLLSSALPPVRQGRPGGVLVQAARLLPVVRGAAHGRSGSAPGRPRVAGRAGAAVGADAAAPRALAVRLRPDGLPRRAQDPGARGVGLLPARAPRGAAAAASLPRSSASPTPSSAPKAPSTADTGASPNNRGISGPVGNGCWRTRTSSPSCVIGLFLPGTLPGSWKARGFTSSYSLKNRDRFGKVDKHNRRWTDKPASWRSACFENRRRVARKKSKGLQRRRSEFVERTFAHVCTTGGARRTWIRGLVEVGKRYLMQVAAHNLGLILRKLFGVGTPRGWGSRADLLGDIWRLLLRLWLAMAGSSRRIAQLARNCRGAARIDHLDLDLTPSSTGC